MTLLPELSRCVVRVRRLGILCLLVWCGRGEAAQPVHPPADRTVIRKVDVIERKQGRPITGVIQTVGNWRERESIEVRTARSVQVTIPTAEIRSVIPRQSVDDIYEGWQDWLRKQSGGDRAWRSRGELELARWCALPHPDLDGRPPKADVAVGHLENSVWLDPGRTEAYPLLVAAYLEAHPVLTAPEEVIDREVAIYQRAREAGFSSPAMSHRMGMLLAQRLDLPEQAAPFLEEVLADPSSSDGQRASCRRALAGVYVGRGEVEKALALYERVLGSGEDSADRFGPLLESARLHMRLGGTESRGAARRLLDRAATARPDYAEVLLDLAALDYVEGDLPSAAKRLKAFLGKRPGDALATIDHSLVQARLGKMAAAEKALRGVLAGNVPTAAARANTALAFVLDQKGDLAGARASYEAALESSPGHVEASLGLASVLLRQKDLERARQVVVKLLDTHAGSRQVFGACCRVLGEIAARGGDLSEASELLEYALDVEGGGDVALLERTGLVFLGLGRLDRGEEYLQRAEGLQAGRPAGRTAAAYVAYQEGEIDEADRLFTTARKAIRALPGSRRSESEKDLLAYVDQSLARIRDLKDLEVWVDEFEGEDGAEIDGWEKVELFGVEVTRREGRATFRGTQKNRADGETSLVLMRRLDARRFERVTASVRVEAGDVAPALRLHLPEDARRSSAGIEISRSSAGRACLRRMTSKSGWEEPEPTPAEGEEEGARSRSSRRRLEYGGGVEWPLDGRYHTLEIRRSRESTSTRSRTVTFDVYFDGQPVARGVGVTGLSGSELRTGIHALARELGGRCAFDVENLKVYREARRR